MNQRHSIRVPGYDYSRSGAYFVTVCTHKRRCIFGNIVNGKMQLNTYGNVAHEQWQRIPQRFNHIELDVFQIMPNHIHGIFIINDPSSNVGAGLAPARMLAPARNDGNPIIVRDNSLSDRNVSTPNRATASRATARVAPTIGNVIGAYKSLVFNECLRAYEINRETMGKLWQRSYYDRIIRNETELNAMREYTAGNPDNWHQDEHYVER